MDRGRSLYYSSSTGGIRSSTPSYSTKSTTFGGGTGFSGTGSSLPVFNGGGGASTAMAQRSSAFPPTQQPNFTSSSYTDRYNSTSNSTYGSHQLGSSAHASRGYPSHDTGIGSSSYGLSRSQTESFDTAPVDPFATSNKYTTMAPPQPSVLRPSSSSGVRSATPGGRFGGGTTRLSGSSDLYSGSRTNPIAGNFEEVPSVTVPKTSSSSYRTGLFAEPQSSYNPQDYAPERNLGSSSAATAAPQPPSLRPSTPRGASSSESTRYGGHYNSGGGATTSSNSTTTLYGERTTSGYPSSSSRQPSTTTSSYSSSKYMTNGATSSSLRAPAGYSTSSSASRFLSKPAGFRNMGNTCYLNATLQCILHSHGFIEKLYKARKHNENGKSRNALTDDVLGLMSNEARSERGVFLSSTKKRVAEINPEFAGHAQNDAHEFLRALFLGLHNEQNTVKGKYKEMKDIRGETDYDAAERWYRYHKEHDDSVIYNTYGGLLKMVTICDACMHRSVSFDPFLDLSVPVPKHPESIERLFDVFTGEEHLQGTDKFMCPTCKKAREAKRRLTVQRWPTLLSVHLKRFNHRGIKNASSVSFSDNVMTQAHWCAIDNNYNGGRGYFDITQDDLDDLPRYKLIGVVCHSGSSTFGHYYAYVCTGSDQWYLCDDQSVRESSARDAIRESVNAYILFYVKVEL